jgi:N-methylhydantoinase A
VADQGRGGFRVGVDIGGTFTKAVAVDVVSGAIVARSVVPTTHDDPAGPAAGVVHVVGEVARHVGPERVELVTHSTTQAVNALLEGDVPTVGVLALGRRPDLKKARARTRLDRVELVPGRKLAVVSEFLDVTDGLDDSVIVAALQRLVAAGASAICVAEAFAPDGGDDERRAVLAAIELGLPACGSSEMTGLYGLELRTVTAALNASILPIAVATAAFVEQGVADAGVRSPVMVMRGDGGAIDAEGFRRAPARTLYSGPAASVAGVLRFSRVTDGVLLEVGGTSTNVAAIKAGKPALSYVQVASHATALRALDVRVIGVAGGSMLRVRRNKVYGVGPRSAHIARLPYSCYLAAADIEGAVTELLAPRPGDPTEYLVLRLADGRRVALTNTCAAVSLGLGEAGDYALIDADRDAATLGFEIAGRRLKLAGPEVARRMLAASAQAIGDLITTVAKEYELRAPTLIAVGGGAGGVGRFVAAELGLDCIVPEGAEVISSIGDALSFIRIERERTVISPRAEDSALLAAEAEEACVAAGASPASVDVRVEFETERSTLRAIATGSVGLEAGALPGRKPIDATEAKGVSVEHGLTDPFPVGSFWIAADPDNGDGSAVLVLDRFGDAVSEGWGSVVMLRDEQAATEVGRLVALFTRQVGPMTTPPTVWLLDANRLIGLAPSDAVEACRAYLRPHDPAAVVVLRS